MKELYVVRHAKSSWDNPQQTDFERPLNERGKNDADLMSKKLQEYSILPDYILCSNAKRTRQTLKRLLKNMPVSEDRIEYKNELYLASAQTLSLEISKLSDKYNKVMVIAHNPGVTDFTNYLLGENIVNFPTLGIAFLELPIDSWQETASRIAVLRHFLYPKMFK
ncbi:MAG TPA: phosphohistidine phosphatase [Flavobacteriales bacterium]|nr:phosphohistidine phosphatase [Flavobacteriales bacterium]|tara:strand:+ start:106982 stop:107476 length:495 start_codon:yes stop_codon:yes gene_type:complete